MKERMDLASVIGFGAAAVALLLFIDASGNSFGVLMNLPAMLFIVAGSFAVTMIGFSLKDCALMAKLIGEAFVQREDNRGEIAIMFAEAAQLMRKDGRLALDAIIPEVEDDTIRRGLEMIADGAYPRALRGYMEDVAERRLYPYETGIGFFRKMGGFSPTLGIVGTVVGLMSALSNLSQLREVGGSVASAFVATLWGVAFANAVCFPLANKLEYRKRVVEEELEMILQGLLSVEKGAGRRELEQKLSTFVGARDEEELAPPRKHKTRLHLQASAR